MKTDSKQSRAKKRRHAIGSTPLIQVFLSVIALTLVSGPGAGFVVRYEIIDLGTLGGFTSVALGINNKGQVVGSADISSGPRRAYLWENGVMQNLGTIPGESQSEAHDINENTQVVGIASDSGNISSAFIWQNGQMSELGDPAQAKDAFAINDAGQVVGAAIFPGPNGGQHAMLLQNDVLTDLGTLGGSISLAWDINNLGQVTGESFTDGSPGGAFLWESGVMSNLGTLGGGGSESRGINDRTEIVGFSSRADGRVAAFLWQDDVMTDIGLLIEPLAAMTSSRAEAINNKGQIIGSGLVQFGVAGAFFEGFLFDPVYGAMLLKDTLPPNSGWSELSPRDINDNGWIVGSGTTPEGLPNHAFLMNPLPPIPATSPALLAILTTAILIAAYVVLTKRARGLPCA